MRFRLTGVFGSTLLWALLLIAPAQAAFPGANGKIAFNEFPGIWVVNPDGTGRRQLSALRDEDPAWSTDGRLVFESERDSFARPEIYVMNADGTAQTRLTNNAAHDIECSVVARQPEDRVPERSGSGSRIQFPDLHDESRRHRRDELTDFPDDGAAEPSWSPDGTKIAFAGQFLGSSRGIYVMNADGTGQTQLTFAGKVDKRPNWSPDGLKIVFDREDDGVQHDIYVMNADGTQQTLLRGGQGSDRDPVWSPDGTKIAFVHQNDLYTMNPDGSGMTLITTSVPNPLLDWQAVSNVGRNPATTRTGRSSATLSGPTWVTARSDRNTVAARTPTANASAISSWD